MEEIKKLAPVILAEIQKANSILLHCHPSPDPDSVGSALAMKFALEQMGKKATVIKGDSDIPQAFMHFPGATEIVKKSFTELDPKEFDLFICQDSSTVDRISTKCSRKDFNPPMKVINIDHHRSNEMFGSINLVANDYPATAQMLYDIFTEWGIEITEPIATNLYIGIYTDTGGLKFGYTNAKSYEIMAALVKKVPRFSHYIDVMEGSKTPGSLAYLGAGLSGIETFLGGKMAVSSISLEKMKALNITEADMDGIHIASFLRNVAGWDIAVAMLERHAGDFKLSFRTRDANKYDLSKIAVAFNGGGHKAAAGASILGVTMDEAKQQIVAKAKELYNL